MFGKDKVAWNQVGISDIIFPENLRMTWIANRAQSDDSQFGSGPAFGLQCMSSWGIMYAGLSTPHYTGTKGDQRMFIRPVVVLPLTGIKIKAEPGTDTLSITAK